MVKVDFNKPIVNLDNAPMKTSDGQTMMMKDIVCNSLCVSRPKIEDARMQLSLAKIIFNAKGPVDIDEYKLSIIKKALIESQLSGLVLGQIMELLETSKA